MPEKFTTDGQHARQVSPAHNDLPDYRERQKQPPRVAIIGAGPAGLEAALYAHRLGLDVLLFERDGQIAADLRGWSRVTLFTPWGDNRTPLGELALRREGSAALPGANIYPAGSEFVQRYLDPLAALLGDDLHRDTRVVAVGRSYLFPEDHADAPERRQSRRFRLLTRSPLDERVFTADYVVDASGVSHSPNWAGAGGLPALGEMGSARHIFYGIPDITGRDRIHFLGKRTLLIGDGASAATSALMLAEVGRLDPAGSFLWVTREKRELPVAVIPNDSLPRRDLLLKKANLLVADGQPGVEHLPLTQVEALQHSLGTGRFQVTLQVDRVTRRLAFDAVIANVGARRDAPTFERHLRENEPGCFVVGAKGVGGELLLPGLRPQVRDLFRQIVGEEAPDLYAQSEAALRSQAALALAADEEKLRAG